ncbi:MAG TPA: ABC transporter ATP-binding protein [Acidobacteriaceae bacterium]|jgi:subfamily B ATP-binding cassette protein MsbA|nr:ABC transporter ATP-binding protein [Acidobacteriaceae bacterium]
MGSKHLLEQQQQAGSAPPDEGRGRSTAATDAKGSKLRKLLPGIWDLVRTRKYLLLFGLFLILVNRASSLVLPYSTGALIDDVFGHGDTHRLKIIVLEVLAATLLQGIATFALYELISKAAWELVADLRIRVQKHILRLPVVYYDANRSGTIVSRIMADVEGIRNLIGTGFVELLGGILLASLSFAFLVYMSPVMTLCSFAVLGSFALILRSVFGSLRPIFRDRSVLLADVTGRLTESFNGVRVIKGYRAENRESSIFADGMRRLLASQKQSLTAIGLMNVASTVVVGVVGALVMFLGARQHFRGGLSVGHYVEYTVFLAYLIAPIIQVVTVGTQLTEAVTGFERTMDILAEPEEDADPRRTVDLVPADLAGQIRFEAVDFAYTPEKPVLQQISLTAEPGSVTALVGPSGSGKSTIISLVCAFHNPGNGRILVDGIDLATVTLDSYRSQLGVVFQESFLFEGTIRDNVRFSRPDAREEEIMEAARIARVDEFALGFPEGWETIVGERGVKLSGGQRQRISIARAILADPRILILDEATSSLDSESEAIIQEGLSYLMRGRTTFVIAHRLSTIRSADQILVVEGGRIWERGRHEELLEARGRYYDLYTRQYRLESNLFLAPGEGDAPVSDEPAETPGTLRAPSFSRTLRGLV